MILLVTVLTLLLCNNVLCECTFLLILCFCLILCKIIACSYCGVFVIVHSVIMAYLVVVYLSL